MIQIGNKILDKRSNTTHVVESICELPTTKVFFTEDSKCIPEDSAKKIVPIWIKFLNNVFFGDEISMSDNKKIKEFFSSQTFFINDPTPEYCENWVREWKKKNL